MKEAREAMLNFMPITRLPCLELVIYFLLRVNVEWSGWRSTDHVVP